MDIRITFYPSGHTLGSALTHLHIGNGLHNILYTSDLLYETSNLLPKAITRYPRLETVIIESTYGGMNDIIASRKESDDLLMATIKKTVEKGGKILMPVLGVGRSQEIMLMIEKAASVGDYATARELWNNQTPIINNQTQEVLGVETELEDQAYPERKVEKRIQELKEKLQDYPEYPDILLEIARLYRAIGNEEAAQEYWEQARILDPNNLIFQP